MKMSNRWNRFVYRLYAPFYDRLQERLFQDARSRAMELAGIHAGERVCLIGIGTGVDLPYLPAGSDAVGIDLSEAMLERARRKLPIPGCRVELRVGDAHGLPVSEDEGPFDVVVLNLILSVVPDASRCMAEALRVLRPGGRIVVFDKFLPDDREPSWRRRLANHLSTVLGTDINRRLGEIVSGQPCRIVHDEPSLFDGAYRVVLLRKANGSGGR